MVWIAASSTNVSVCVLSAERKIVRKWNIAATVVVVRNAVGGFILLGQGCGL